MLTRHLNKHASNFIALIALLPFLMASQPASAAEIVLSFVIGKDRLDMVSGDIVSAQPIFDANNMPAVTFTLSKLQASAFGDMTTRGVGQTMDLLVCGKLMTRPVIQSPIYGGSGMITGNFTTEEATQMAIVLKTGACSDLTS